MLRVLLITLLSLLTILSFAQVNGTVKDVETKEGIGYASVYWKVDKTGVLTNELGEYSIHESKNENDTLVISYVGYQPLETKSNKLPKNETYLLRMSNEIETVVITTLSAQEIMAKASENFKQNMFKNRTQQSGYIKSRFYDNNELFQISQSTYKLGHTNNKKGKPQQKVYVQKMRSVLDSALYKSINNELNFKRESSVLGPDIFISMGQDVDFGSGGKSNKRITTKHTLQDEIDYQGEYVYVIDTKHYYKGQLMVTGKQYIEKETFAYLLVQVETNPNFDLNQLVRGASKLVIKIMGFEYDFKGAKIALYYKRNAKNPELFDLEKGLSSLSMNLKRTDRWIKGKVVQEFYLAPRKAMTTTLQNNFDSQVLVANFDDKQFFKGQFHLPTSGSEQREIKKLNENNANYTGTITADRHDEWKAKKDKKQAKRKARKERKK